MRRLCIVLLLLAACALLSAASAESLFTLDETQSFIYIPNANGDYGLYGFRAAEGANPVRAKITQNGATIAEGEGLRLLCEARLTAGESYTVTVENGEGMMMEVARERLSGCFDDPLELTAAQPYTKILTRPYDAHWYAFTPSADGAALFWALSADTMSPSILLFDEDGVLQSRGEPFGASGSICETRVTAGERVYLRISDEAGSCGKYTVTAAFSEETGKAEGFILENDAITIDGLDTAYLDYEPYPWGSATAVALRSTDPDIVAVTENNTITSVAPGDASIELRAYGGATCEIPVHVEAVSAKAIRLNNSLLVLGQGDSSDCGAKLRPRTATDASLSYLSADENIAAVDENGTVTAVSEGETVITVSAGSLRAELRVVVEAPRPHYRALLIGEENYAVGVESVRSGSNASVNAVADALKLLSFQGATYAVTTLTDAPRDTIISGLRTVFADATENDVSLVYITCHGALRAGMTQFLAVDGSVLSAEELASELSKIPGTVILMADCCASGALIGQTDLTPSVTEHVGAFLSGDRFYIIASALSEEDSYRIGKGSDFMTSFARAFRAAATCIGDYAAADTDQNGEVSFTELTRYLQKSVSLYAAQTTADEQTVCSLPAQSARTVMAFSAAE